MTYKLTLVNIKSPLLDDFYRVFSQHRMPKEESWFNQESFELESLVTDMEDTAYWQNVHSDCMISRGYSYVSLRSIRSDIPIVEPPFFIFDAIHALHKCQARYLGEKIAVIASRRSLFGVPDVAKQMKINAMFYYAPIASHLAESQKCVQRAIHDGCTVIAAGAQILERVNDSSVKKVIIDISEESIYYALTEAKRLAFLYRQQRERNENYRTIIDTVHDGVFAVDQNKRILVCNDAAQKYLNMQEGSLVNQDIHSFPKLQPFIKLIDKLPASSNHLLNYNGKIFTVNKADSFLTDTNIGSVLTFQDITEVHQLERNIHNKIKQEGHLAKHTFEDIIGSSRRITESIEKAREFSQSESNLLIVGETGVGKELFAQGIHNASSRRNSAFVAVNCAALTESLLESELFGYVDGAFTGAAKGGRPGLFEMAHGGTIFLDEVSEISLSTQAKLLRVLQEREVRRIGASNVIPIDIRIICATNRNLQDEVRAKRFRNDLYYRLNVLQLYIPPLCHRDRDCIQIMEHALEARRLASGRPPLHLTEGAGQVLLHHTWPGNIRELFNVAERVFVLGKTAEISADAMQDALRDNFYDFRAASSADLPQSAVENPAPYPSLPQSSTEIWSSRAVLPDNMRERILQALAVCGNNRTRAARLLGVSRCTLWRKMKTYGIHLPDDSEPDWPPSVHPI